MSEILEVTRSHNGITFLVAIQGIPSVHQDNDLDRELYQILEESDAFLDRVGSGEFGRLFGIRAPPLNHFTYQTLPDISPPTPTSPLYYPPSKDESGDLPILRLHLRRRNRRTPLQSVLTINPKIRDLILLPELNLSRMARRIPMNHLLNDGPYK